MKPKLSLSKLRLRYTMETKIIKVSDEVLDMLSKHREYETDSLNRIIVMLLNEYDPLNVYVRNSEGSYVLMINNDPVALPELSPVHKTVRVASDVYDRLLKSKSHPDESFNLTLCKLSICYDALKDPIRRMHKAYYSAFGEYAMYIVCANPETREKLIAAYESLGSRKGRQPYSDFWDQYEEFKKIAGEIQNNVRGFWKSEITGYAIKYKDYFDRGEL